MASPRITHPYSVRGIDAKFASGCENLMSLRFYTSADDQAPTSGAPSGVSILADYGQVDYVVGDNDAKHLVHDVMVAEGGSFLKVYADNDDYFDHDVDVQMTIEEVERGS